MITRIVAALHLDPFQSACRLSRSVDDAVNTGLRFVPQYMDNRAMYADILFVDFSSSFSTSIPDLKLRKLSQMTVDQPTCKYIYSFLTNHKQYVQIGPDLSTYWFICISASQGYVLSLLLYSLYNNDIQWSLSKITEFADKTMPQV